ncbi:translation initiation factor IF-3 [Stappia indica]|uniref:translation initiation factor IF-3 n=1 Tax=Stappia indica TaxID=538381 RepID=UPI001CD76CD6|nr:translation initiation factor IF-3 [Stappia indica]MCA1299702.1 translation initiation factor IF-3 [Stappia indica]
MIDGGGFVLQVIRIVVGFICAMLAAGLFLAFGFVQAVDLEGDPVAAGAAFGSGLIGASVIGGFAFLPACLAILLSEALRLRGVIFHLAAGGAIGFGLWMLGDAAPADPARAAMGGLPPGSTVAASAGFLAGFVYWLIAGRCAGRWRLVGNLSREPGSDGDPGQS